VTGKRIVIETKTGVADLDRVSTENDHGHVAVTRGHDHAVVIEEERKEADLGMLILLTIVLLEFNTWFMKIIVFEQ
jgi:hypothetical protein